MKTNLIGMCQWNKEEKLFTSASILSSSFKQKDNSFHLPKSWSMWIWDSAREQIGWRWWWQRPPSSPRNACIFLLLFFQFNIIWVSFLSLSSFLSQISEDDVMLCLVFSLPCCWNSRSYQKAHLTLMLAKTSLYCWKSNSC